MLEEFLQLRYSSVANEFPLNFNKEISDRKIYYITLLQQDELIQKRLYKKPQQKEFKGFKNILAIINVISQSNYPKKMEEILELISNSDNKPVLIAEVFEILVKKGSSEKLYRQLYSEICKSIINQYTKAERKPIRKQLQDMLENIFFEFIDEQGFTSGNTIEEKEINANLNDKYLGSLHFIGHLHNSGIISRGVILQIFGQLMEQNDSQCYKDYIIEAMCNCYNSINSEKEEKLTDIKEQLNEIKRESMTPREYHILQIALGNNIIEETEQQITIREYTPLMEAFNEYKEGEEISEIDQTPDELMDFIIGCFDLNYQDMKLAFCDFIPEHIRREISQQTINLINEDIGEIKLDVPKADEYIELIAIY